MERTRLTDQRIRARDAALGLLNRLTLGAGIAAVAAVGVFSAVSAETIPGSATSSPSSDPTTATSSSSTASNSSGSLQTSTGVSSSSGVAQAVTGSSH